MEEQNVPFIPLATEQEATPIVEIPAPLSTLRKAKANRLIALLESEYEVEGDDELTDEQEEWIYDNISVKRVIEHWYSVRLSYGSLDINDEVDEDQTEGDVYTCSDCDGEFDYDQDVIDHAKSEFPSRRLSWFEFVQFTIDYAIPQMKSDLREAGYDFTEEFNEYIGLLIFMWDNMSEYSQQQVARDLWVDYIVSFMPSWYEDLITDYNVQD